MRRRLQVLFEASVREIALVWAKWRTIWLKSQSLISEYALELINAWSPSSPVTGWPTALQARVVARLLAVGASCQVEAPIAYVFRSAEHDVSTRVVTFEEQPVRHVVRLMVAVMLVVGRNISAASRASQPVTAFGRLVGELGARAQLPRPCSFVL